MSICAEPHESFGRFRFLRFPSACCGVEADEVLDSGPQATNLNDATARQEHMGRRKITPSRDENCSYEGCTNPEALQYNHDFTRGGEGASLESNAEAPQTVDSCRRALGELEAYSLEFGCLLDWSCQEAVEKVCLE